MHIRPELQALRGDDTPQRLAQAALRDVHENWYSHGPGNQAEAEVARFADGAALDDLPLLSALFTPDDPSAAQFADDLVARLLRQLAEEPLGQVPLRYSTDETISSLVLVRQGMATLALQAIDGAGLARRPVPVSASFPPAETYERTLEGCADAVQVRVLGLRPGAADLECRDVALLPGTIRHRLGSHEAQLLRRVPGSLVTLKLQRRLAVGAVTREHLLADGTQIHQAAGCPRDSRLELAAALLGRMGRTDAAPLLAAMAEEQGSAPLRWQALRECLGLDTAAGFAVLCQIAQRPDDPLATSAGALRAQLLESYPQLAGVRPCPA